MSLSQNEHTTLLLDSGLLIEHKTPRRTSNSDDDNKEEENHIYTFFDPLLHEYTCALYYSKNILTYSEDLADIRKTLFTSEWKNVCVFVAGILGKEFGVLLKEMDFEYLDDCALNILAESLNQCQCPKLCLKEIENIAIPDVVDFSELTTSSSTVKGKNYHQVNIQRIFFNREKISCSNILQVIAKLSLTVI